MKSVQCLFDISFFRYLQETILIGTVAGDCLRTRYISVTLCTSCFLLMARFRDPASFWNLPFVSFSAFVKALEESCGGTLLQIWDRTGGNFRFQVPSYPELTKCFTYGFWLHNSQKKILGSGVYNCLQELLPCWWQTLCSHAAAAAVAWLGLSGDSSHRNLKVLGSSNYFCASYFLRLQMWMNAQTSPAWTEAPVWICRLHSLTDANAPMVTLEPIAQVKK